VTTVTYPADRLIFDSAVGFERTRSTFDEQVPLLDPLIPPNLNLSIARYLRQQIPPARSTVFPDAYNVMLDDPTQFASVITSAIAE
jgi:hypothetical protein